MVLDRNGKTVSMGFSLSELLWIEAANTIADPQERRCAFRDIGELTGRGYKNIREKAKHLRNEGMSAVALRRLAEAAPAAGPVSAPSPGYRPPMALLMGGKASVAKGR